MGRAEACICCQEIEPVKNKLIEAVTSGECGEEPGLYEWMGPSNSLVSVTTVAVRTVSHTHYSRAIKTQIQCPKNAKTANSRGQNAKFILELYVFKKPKIISHTIV